MKIKKPWLVVMAAGILAIPQDLVAKTVAWYRFEEATSGVTTQTSVFTNTIDATKYPAYPAVCAFNGNNKYTKAGLSYTAADMPISTNAFPSTIALTTPGEPEPAVDNNGALAINMDRPGQRGNPVGTLLIDDDPELRLKTFTIEFYARLADMAQEWRCLFCRTAHAYGIEPILLRGQVNGAGQVYLQYDFRAVADPLVDDKGFVTNSVKYSNTVSGSDNMDNDRWRHFAFVVDGAAHKGRIYIDHVEKASFAYEGDICYDAGYPFAFGANPQCSYYGCSEAIDEIRISDVALAPEEMLNYGRKKAKCSAVDGNTLFYLPFEGSQEPVTLGDGDMSVPVTYVPFYANEAVNPLYASVDARTANLAKTANPAVPSSDPDVPTEGERFGLRGQVFTENETAVHILTNAVSSYAQPVVIPEDKFNQAQLASDSFTVEMYFKAITPGFMATTAQCHFFTMVNVFAIKTQENAVWNSGWIDAAVGSTSLRRPHSIATQQTCVPGYCNGQWHHLAVVYDKPNHRAEFYLDYQRVLWSDEVTGVSESRHANYYDGILIGGSFWTERSVGNMLFDEVRISRGALRPHQFLTTKPIEPDMLAVASFENDLLMMPYTSFFGETGIASAFTASGTSPTFDLQRPARILTEGRNGSIVTDSNRRSLKFDGGKVTYENRALLADTDEFTVQFFMKAPSALPGAGIARVNRESATDVANSVMWALSFADATGALSLKVDTTAEEGQVHAFSGASFADGAWHHVGLQFVRNGGDTVVNLYRDAALVGAWNVAGRLLTNPFAMNFMLGAGEDPSAGFTGWIDELRVAPGVVAPEKFLTAFHNGLAIILR